MGYGNQVPCSLRKGFTPKLSNPILSNYKVDVRPAHGRCDSCIQLGTNSRDLILLGGGREDNHGLPSRRGCGAPQKIKLPSDAVNQCFAPHFRIYLTHQVYLDTCGYAYQIPDLTQDTDIMGKIYR